MKIYITKSYFLQYKIQAQFPHVSLRSESFQQELFSPPMKVGKSHKLHGTHLSLVATKNVSKEAVGLIFKYFLFNFHSLIHLKFPAFQQELVFASDEGGKIS